MTSDKALTNRKFTASKNYRDNYAAIFGAPKVLSTIITLVENGATLTKDEYALLEKYGTQEQIEAAVVEPDSTHS